MIPKFFRALPLIAACLASAADAPPDFQGRIERLDPALDALIPPNAKIEVLATGFNWSEGPVWKNEQILFSDVPENTVFAWKEGDAAASVFLKPSGSLSGDRQGSNGLAVDASGALILTQQGERRIARLEKDGHFTVLAKDYEGRRFNSPNDLVITRGGALYFTDPPYGMKKGEKPDADLHGVYRVAPDGTVSLAIADLRWPNGVALSPDEKTLYIAVSDKQDTRIMAYDLRTDGSVAHARTFFTANALKAADRPGLCDGMKVDAQGNIWTTGPGGVLVLNSEGKHLGTIHTGVPTGNCAWGGKARGDLYITADMFLLRVKTLAKGL